MKISIFIEKYFGAFLGAGILFGLIFPVHSPFLLSMLKPLLMVMLFLVYLKIETKHLFHKKFNYKLTAVVILLNMLVLPLGFFLP